jgi:hypothetical protein
MLSMLVGKLSIVHGSFTGLVGERGNLVPPPADLVGKLGNLVPPPASLVGQLASFVSRR